VADFSLDVPQDLPQAVNRIVLNIWHRADISPDTFSLLAHERNALIIAAAQRAGATVHRYAN
jgi:hypothetical protein